jgi:hypothetical protein
MTYNFIVSKRKNKKYDVYKNGKYLVSFGSKGNQQFKDKTPLKAYSHLDHLDKDRKERYYKRFGKEAVFESAKWFSHRFLW